MSDWVAQLEDLMAGDSEPSDGISLSSSSDEDNSKSTPLPLPLPPSSASKRIPRIKRVRPKASAAPSGRAEKKFQPTFMQKWK